MLFYGNDSPVLGAPSRSGVMLQAAASPSVKELQQTLTDLSAQTGQSMINPGPIDGVVGTKTRLAVSQALAYVGPKLPSHLKYLGVGVAAAAVVGGSSVDTYIHDYASQISAAIRIAMMAIAQAGGGDAGGYPAVEEPWYKKTWGMAAIGVGGVVVLYLIFGGKKTAAAPAPAAT